MNASSSEALDRGNYIGEKRSNPILQHRCERLLSSRHRTLELKVRYRSSLTTSGPTAPGPIKSEKSQSLANQ